MSQTNMRRFFADKLYKKMSKNKKIWVLTGDLGYKLWDDIKKDFASRFINVGAAEQSMMGIAVGLAIGGQIPIVYSITTFLIYRPFETIRNYLQHEKIPVKLIGSGRNKDYIHDGISHWAQEDKKIMRTIFTNIHAYWPDSNKQLDKLLDEMLVSNEPWYINLTKKI